MKRPSAKDELRTGLTESLHAALTEITGQRSTIPDQLIEQAVGRVIEDWRVTRVDTPNIDEHPLAPQPDGHYLKVTLPHVPETDDERADREARTAAARWAWEARMFSWDPQDPGYDNSECPPPPERVGVSQLLDQGLWWRARMNPDSTDTQAIRLADMTHSHRMALLAFLRRNAPRYKMREDWMYVSIPGPQGEMAQDAFEAECDRQWNTPASEWLEDQPLVRALVHWTTPVAESPLTWRPMNEAPRIHETVIVVRYPSPDGEQTAQVVPSLTYEWATFPDYEPLTVSDGHGGFEQADPIEWRELRDDELPTPVPAFDPNCPHGVPDDEHCFECAWSDLDDETTS